MARNTLIRYALLSLFVLAASEIPAWAAPARKDKPSAKLLELQRQRVKALEEQLQGQFERSCF